MKTSRELTQIIEDEHRFGILGVSTVLGSEWNDLSEIEYVCGIPVCKINSLPNHALNNLCLLRSEIP